MPRIRAENIEAHKALTRREILDAVHDLIAETGSAEVSLGEVATTVGIGRTTLYEYFRDRDDLIASMVEERLPEVITEIIERVPEHLPVEDRLSMLAVGMVRFVVEDHVLGRILHRELTRLSQTAQDRILLIHTDLSKEMASIYRQGVSEGRFRQLPMDVAGRFIQDLIMAAAKVLNNSAHPEQRFDEVAEALGTFLVGGLSAI